MKKKLLLISCGLALTCFAVAFSVRAAGSLRSIMVSFDPVRFIVNGKDVTPSNDVFYNGRAYVPDAFDYAGTTYIPLRYLTSTSNLPIQWDERSRIITIGQGVETSQVYLSDLPWKGAQQGANYYAIFDNNNTDANGKPIISDWTQMNVRGEAYQKGIAIGAGGTCCVEPGSYLILTFKLDGLYSRLETTVGYDAANHPSGGTNCTYGYSDRIAFIGDGRTLYSASLGPDTTPALVDFSLSGVQTLKVRIENGSEVGNCADEFWILDIVNPVLTKLYQ